MCIHVIHIYYSYTCVIMYTILIVHSFTFTTLILYLQILHLPDKAERWSVQIYLAFA